MANTHLTKWTKKQLRRHNFILILLQNIQGFSSEYSDWKRESIVTSMQENNTDIYCVQETGNHVNKSVNIHDYLLLTHRLPIHEKKYAKGG